MNIEWLKNKLGEKFYPITHAGSVLCGDSNETLETKLVALDESIGAKANASDLTDHTENTNNPHNVTAEQTPYDPTESGLSAKNVQDAVDEVNTDIESVESQITTNLLKPTLETTTVNGVTCTNNGDGTYTLSGTANKTEINKYIGKFILDKYDGSKLNCLGQPYGFADVYLYFIFYDSDNKGLFELNPGTGYDSNRAKDCSNVKYIDVGIYGRLDEGKKLNNVLIKPMITTNINATYDDFVPFTGTTGHLNSDVAELEKSNENKMDKKNPTGTGAFSMNRKADTTVGENSTTEGNDCTASGNYSHAEGLETNATQERAHAEGYGTNASGYQAHTEGHWTVASGQSSHAEGESTLAQGYETHAEGNGTKAIGNFCHVEGHNTTALSDASHSEGSSTNRAPDSITSSSANDDIISSWNSSKFSLAKGAHSHVEGCDCLALGDGSHAEGARTKAVGDMSHSGGCATEATGRSSCAIGEMVSARYDYQTAIGILNHNKEENIFEVGNGISDSTGIEKSNALELTRTGDLAIAGDFYFTDANGNKISMRDILTRLVALEPGFSVDVEG